MNKEWDAIFEGNGKLKMSSLLLMLKFMKGFVRCFINNTVEMVECN